MRHETGDRRYEIGDRRYETGDRNTPLNKSLTQFAHWANKEQIAKRKEHPSVHSTAEIKN